MSSHHSSDINNRGDEYDSNEESESDFSDVKQDTSSSDQSYQETDVVSNKKQRCENNIMSLCERIVNDISGNETNEAFYECGRGHIYVTDDEARNISQALRTNTTIEILAIKGFIFTIHGFATFIEGVASCKSLKHLKLEGKCTRNDLLVDIAQIELLADTLKEKNNSYSFTGLELDNYNIGCDGMITIFEALLNNSVIETIIMTNTIYELDDARSEDSVSTSSSSREFDQWWLLRKVGGIVANVLQRNVTLRVLDLSYNPLDNEVIVIIVDGLRTNTTLRELSLNETGITDTGAFALANVLKINKTLEGLNLNHNTFSKVGLLAFSDALKINKSLIKLDMIHHLGNHDVEWDHDSHRNDDFTYLATFLKVLEYNTTVQSLGVFDEDVDFEAFLSHETKQSIIGSLEYNDTILDFSGGFDSAPELFQQILNQNANKTRVAPKKGGHNRRTIYNWLITHFLHQ